MPAESGIKRCNSPVGESSSSTYTANAAKLRQRLAQSRKPRVRKYHGPPVCMAVDTEYEALPEELGAVKARIHLLTVQLKLECDGRSILIGPHAVVQR